MRLDRLWNDEPEDLTVIVGCGRLCAAAASSISDREGSVVVIDHKEDAFMRLPLSYSGLTVRGNGADLDVLQEAGLSKARRLLVLTSDDNVNIMAAQIGFALFHVQEILVRLNDPNERLILESMPVQVICPFELSEKRMEELLEQEAEK